MARGNGGKKSRPRESFSPKDDEFRKAIKKGKVNSPMTLVGIHGERREGSPNNTMDAGSDDSCDFQEVVSPENSDAIGRQQRLY